MTGFIGICLLLFMMILASLANEGQASIFRGMINFSAILGMVWMIWPKRKLSILSLDNKPMWIQKPQHFFRHSSFMIGGQILFLVFSMIFMCFIEIQTQSNHRLTSLPTGAILALIKNDPLTFFFWPWVLYGVTGVGLGYFCLYKDRIPNLFNALIPPTQQQPKLFFHNYLSTTVFMTLVIPIFTSMALIIFLLADGLNGLFGSPSFFESPIRSFFLTLCACMTLIRINTRHLHIMVEKRNSLGKILVSYAAVAGLFLWWLSWMASLAFEAIPEAVFLGTSSTAKSILLQSMSEADAKTRLTLLVWSWWLIWLPIVSSFVARYTIGKNMALSFLASILFPFSIFLILYWPGDSGIVLQVWQSIGQALKNPETKVLLAVAISALLYFTLRRTHSISDLLRGFMLDFGRMRRFPLTNWVSSTLYCLVAYMSSLFLIGWLGLQILATVAAWFMTTLLMSFVVALYLENLTFTKNFIKSLFKSPQNV